jgi:diguanylate cyclase (GGDEF)-like protein
MATDGQLTDVLSEFARTMLTDFPIQGILDHLVSRIVEILPITSAGVTLISPNTSPRYVAASDDAALRYEDLQTQLGEGPCLAAYRTGAAVAVPDLRSDERFKVFGRHAIDAGLAAVFTFPLHHGARELGALDLYRDTPGPLNDQDMKAAQTLADVTAAYLANARARADLQDASDRSRESAVHDALTGLPNRVLLLERLEHALSRSRRSEHLVAILFVDLDRFKDVNDMHGHQVGDDLLVAVSRRIGGMVRPGDTLARLSGDEFIVLCEDLSQEGQAQLVARRIVDALAVPFLLARVEVQLTASVGVAFAGRGQHDAQQLLQQADIAMYQVKRKGGSDSQVIDLREQNLADAQASLRHDLSQALKRQQLRLDYQPIVRPAGNGMVVGAEALLRWDHPTRGPIAPTTVIPLAEQSDDLAKIGHWVLTQACVDRHLWGGEQGFDTFLMTVNVSARQLLSSDFVALVSSVLTSTDTKPNLLALELTEKALIRDPTRALVVMNEVHALGVLLAFDNFGTGYSSLSYLKEFPFDFVKIDQAVTSDLVTEPANHAMVTKVIELAHLLGIQVICEGVETEKQHDELIALGSDLCQGYYFARPLSANLLEKSAERLKLAYRKH